MNYILKLFRYSKQIDLANLVSMLFILNCINV